MYSVDAMDIDSYNVNKYRTVQLLSLNMVSNISYNIVTSRAKSTLLWLKTLDRKWH
jgi:hypothetical protein